MGIHITHYRNRSASYVLTVLDEDGEAVVFVANDVFRVKIGRGRATPLLDLSSKAATVNGSSLTKANPSTLVLDQDDATMAPGVYDLECAIVDDSDSDRIKHANLGVFALIDTPGGSVTI